MQEKREQLFLTQLREKTRYNRDGQPENYMIGNFQACDVIVKKSKKSRDTWNMFLLQAKLKDNGAQQQNQGNETGGFNADEIPF